MVLKYFLAWFLMIPIAVLNGTVREFVYGPRMSELAAHQLSTFIAMVLFAVYTWILGRIMPLAGALQALQVGLMWLVLTVVFEFGMGRFISGHSWSRLFEDYNLLAGRVWVLIPMSVFVLPYLVNRFQQ